MPEDRFRRIIEIADPPGWATAPPARCIRNAAAKEITAAIRAMTPPVTAPEVSDATFERTKAVFGERGIVDLTYLLGFYGMIGGVLKVAAVTPPDGSMPLEPMEAPFVA